MKADRDVTETWVLQVLPDRTHATSRYVHFREYTHRLEHTLENRVKDATEFVTYDSAWRYIRDILLGFGHVIRPVKMINERFAKE